ncbi:hypothetical protein D3C87_2031010 [compost metagenome]
MSSGSFFNASAVSAYIGVKLVLIASANCSAVSLLRTIPVNLKSEAIISPASFAEDDGNW